GLTPNMNSLFF
nr:FF-amide peptide [Lymnaea stagnalis]